MAMRISELAAFSGQEATIRGWLVSLRKGGKIRFLVVRDGSGTVQAVVRQEDAPTEVWERCADLSQEASLEVRGTVRLDQRAQGGVELAVRDLIVISDAADFPISPKEHGVDFLMDNRHLWLRSRRQAAILRIRSQIELFLQVELGRRGFVRVDSPILTPSACEGTTTLFETDYFEQKAYLSQSGQLYNEAAAAALGRVYCFGPTFRAEKSKTRRHLVEFWMLEPEIAFASLDDVMDLEEDLISALVRHLLKEAADDLVVLERSPQALLAAAQGGFARITYDQAVEVAVQAGQPVTWGEDFGSPQETAIAAAFDRPVFVHRYPTACKAFYMQPDPERPEVCLSVDLLAPEGYGEIAGGGQRIHDFALLRERLAQHNLPEDAYRWYLDLRQWGSQPHAGFGLGIERTLSWLCGLDHVRETIPFPRLLTRLYP
jgi:asparaginyl-tRNA synthetase